MHAPRTLNRLRSLIFKKNDMLVIHIYFLIFSKILKPQYIYDILKRNCKMATLSNNFEIILM